MREKKGGIYSQGVDFLIEGCGVECYGGGEWSEIVNFTNFDTT